MKKPDAVLMKARAFNQIQTLIDAVDNEHMREITNVEAELGKSVLRIVDSTRKEIRDAVAKYDVEFSKFELKFRDEFPLLADEQVLHGARAYEFEKCVRMAFDVRIDLDEREEFLVKDLKVQVFEEMESKND